MSAYPTRTTGSGFALLPAFAALALSSHLCLADSPGERTAALQAAGTQIRLAQDQLLSGHSPDTAQIARLRQAVANLRTTGSDDARFVAKYASVQRLLALVETAPTHLADESRQAPPRSVLDIESISPHHGDVCDQAMGLSQTVPVRVALGAAGESRSVAWFRFLPSGAGHYHFSTSSSGPDPEIDVFGSCSGSALASDDDTLGLDAAVTVSAKDRSPVFVRVSNSGRGGNVDLTALATNATISGKVIDANTGLPLANIQVQAAITWFFVLKYYGLTDQDGNYSIPVDAGDYYVGAYHDSYVTQIYPGADCLPSMYYGLSGCPTASAQVLSIGGGGTATNINFALDHGHQILGQLRDKGNLPVHGTVTLSDDAGNTLVNAYADDAGHYAIGALPTASYKVSAQATGHGSQMFDHIACGGALQTQCDLTQATSLEVSDHDLVGINFSLPQLAAIHGTVAGPDPTQTLFAYIYVIDGSGGWVSQGGTYGGSYVTDPLAPGTYYVYASAGGYFDQLFEGLDCPQSCPTTVLANATPIVISDASQQVEADFQLHRLPVFHGHVQDATTGLPLPDVTVSVSINPPATFTPHDWTTTDNNGDYSLDTISSGTYYVWALSGDHIDQVYPGIACESLNSQSFNPTAVCDVSAAVRLTVAPGVVPPVFNFSLDASSTIGGTATIKAGQASNMPAFARITVYDSNGLSVAVALSDAQGHYAVHDIPPGNYFAAADGAPYSYNYLQQVWKQLDCPDLCAPTTGTPIPVMQGTSVNGVDFNLTWRDAIVGRTTDQDGKPVAGAIIDLFESTDGSYRDSGISDPQGYYAALPNAFSTYFVATEAGDAYVDQVYSGISCPNGPAYYGLCALTTAAPVVLSSGNSQAHIVNFILKSRDVIFESNFE